MNRSTIQKDVILDSLKEQEVKVQQGKLIVASGTETMAKSIIDLMESDIISTNQMKNGNKIYNSDDETIEGDQCSWFDKERYASVRCQFSKRATTGKILLGTNTRLYDLLMDGKPTLTLVQGENEESVIEVKNVLRFTDIKGELQTQALVKQVNRMHVQVFMRDTDKVLRGAINLGNSINLEEFMCNAKTFIPIFDSKLYGTSSIYLVNRRFIEEIKKDTSIFHK